MIPKSIISRLLFCFVIIFFLLPQFAMGQQNNFQVIHLPRKANYSKDKLNTELSSLKDKEAVKKLLRSKNFPANTSLIIYISRPNNQSSYWTINTSSPGDKEDNRIILQSRDNATTKIFKLTEFKNLLKDTLAIIDTLSLELLIRDDDYPGDEYTLSSLCGKTKTESTIPFVDGKLVFTKDLLKGCNGNVAVSTLHHQNNHERKLASFQMNFLSAEQKETILSMAGFMAVEEPKKDTKEIALVVYGYALNHYGRFHFPQLLNWLEKNKVATGHGNHQ
jgi:hypothetical protein